MVPTSTGFAGGPREDLHLYDLERAAGTRGDLAFDPRVLGLSDTLSCGLSVQDCLWSQEPESVANLGSERINGVNVWRVRARRGEEKYSDYWIEEPSFRVHRRTTVAPGRMISVTSEFDGSDSNSPFPTKVVAKREGASAFDQEQLVRDFETDVLIAPERFTIAAMDLPVNTPVVGLSD